MRPMVERCMASSLWRLTSSAARSSSAQRVATQRWSAVASEASVITSRRSAGGKKAGPPRTWGVLQAREALLEEALPPECDGVAMAVEFLGDGAVGGLVGSRSAEDDAHAEGEGLRSGSGAVELFEACSIRIGEDEGGCVGEGHGSLRAAKKSGCP